jgi:hypothetical protein
MLKIVLSFIVCTFSCNILAEPKMLVCTTTLASEVGRLTAVMNKPDASERSKVFVKGIIKKCSDSGANFGHKKIFTFDTLGLKNTENSKVEVMESGSCGVEPTDTLAGQIEATPNVITFKYNSNPKDDFNVDRKTLTGGRDTFRDFTCVLKDIDTSQNIL